MRKIVLLDRKTLADSVDVSGFRAFGDLEIHELTPKEAIADTVADAEIVILNKAVLTSEDLKKAGKLKLICLLATGYNNVDTHYCGEHGIAVCNVPDYSTKSVAQHTFGLALSLIEHTAFYDQYVKSGTYTASGVPTYHGRPYFELDGKTWGIIGLGHIGREVAGLAQAFGCRVIYYSTTGKNQTDDYPSCTLEELLRRSDIVSVHCALNPKTDHLIGARQLRQMKRSAILINMARGRIAVEQEVAAALKEGVIRGFCTDVFEAEPPAADSPLLDPAIADRLMFSPHIAWGSVEAQTRLIHKVCENIESFDAGERLNRVV